jgi:PhnB protein
MIGIEKKMARVRQGGGGVHGNLESPEYAVVGLAFGATEVYHLEDAAGSGVSRLSIDGAEFWLSDESPEHGNFSPESLGGGTVKMLLTVLDPDAWFAKAVAAGAREVYSVQEGHGWRVGRVVDPYGHHWEIGKPLST